MNYFNHKIIISIIFQFLCSPLFGEEDLEDHTFKVKFEVIDNKMVKVKIVNQSKVPIVLCLMKGTEDKIVMSYEFTLIDYSRSRYSSPHVTFPQTTIPINQFTYVYLFGGGTYEYDAIYSDSEIKEFNSFNIHIKYFDSSNIVDNKTPEKFNIRTINLLKNE